MEQCLTKQVGCSTQCRCSRLRHDGSVLSLLLILPSLNYLCVFPYAAGVVLRSRDDRVAFVVKSARENFVFVAIQYLQLVSRVSGPDPACLVAARCDDLVSLRIELNFTDFIFMALQKRYAGSREDIIDARQTVCTGGS